MNSYGIILYGEKDECCRLTAAANEASQNLIKDVNRVIKMRENMDFALGLVPVDFGDLFGPFLGSFGDFIFKCGGNKPVYSHINDKIGTLLQKCRAYRYLLTHAAEIADIKQKINPKIKTSFCLTGMNGVNNNYSSDFGYLPDIFEFLQENPTHAIILSITLPTARGKFAKWNDILVNITSCGKEKNDDFWDCALREFHEETRLYLSDDICRQNKKWLNWGRINTVMIPIHIDGEMVCFQCRDSDCVLCRDDAIH